MRKYDRPTLARFEEQSLALFAALVLASAGAMAQTQPDGTEGETGFVQTQSVDASAQKGKRSLRADEAFSRADTNGDGKLSRDESQRLPAVWERFDEFDANHDHQLSRDEFHRGIGN